MPQTEKRPPATSGPQRSITSRMVMQAFILTAFVIVVLSTLSFIISRMMIERAVRSQLSSVATIAEDALQETLQSNRERAALLTSHSEIKAVLAGNAGADTLQRLLISLQRNEASIIGIEVYDANAVLLSGAGEAIGLPEEAQRIPFYRAVITDKGWEMYDVFTPVWTANQEKAGYIAIRYNATVALGPLLSITPTLGRTAETMLIVKVGDETRLIHPSLNPDDSYVLLIGENGSSENLTMLHALSGEENVTRAEDYKGVDSLVAYRYLPSLGWGLAIQVDRRAALEEVRRLAVAHAAIGTLLLMLALGLSSMLAHQVTEPLRILTERVRALKPGAWQIERSVHTGDEVEVMEEVMADMAGRLKIVYDKQEEIIDERTSELTKQYALDRAILENIGYGVLTVNRDGKVTAANPAVTAMLGTTADQVIAHDISDVIRLSGEGGNPLEGEHPILACVKDGKGQQSPLNAHYSIRRNDDTMLPVVYVISPLLMNGSTFGAVMVLQDVTEARKVDYLKSEFISLASHQLRTPLSAIRWYTELMAEDQSRLNEEEKAYLLEMQHSVERMVALLNSLLHAAHLEGDNLVPEIHELDLKQIMMEVQADSQSFIQEAGLTCAISMPKDDVKMETDETLLRIVLQNLLSNAMKYSPKNAQKHLYINVSQTADAVSISVQDEGMGIPADEQPRVFQKFFRAKNVRIKDTDGNGLGLYITRSIIERLDGTVTFTSQENKGTTFTVVLPKKMKTAEVKK